VGATTVGHLALFNQQVHKLNKRVEWVYSESEEGESTEWSDAPESSPSSPTTTPPTNLSTPQVQTQNPLLFKLEKRSRSIPTTPVWYVKVLLDGEYFGKGRGNTKKAARDEAAKEGLARLGVLV